jgi:hypothetical protein
MQYFADVFKKQNKARMNADKLKTQAGSDGQEATTGIIVLALVILFLIIGIWVWAVVVTIKYWDSINVGARVIAIIGLLPFIPLGPVITLIAVYVSKDQGAGSTIDLSSSSNK